MNQINEAYAPTPTPDEIQNDMFLPLMKQAYYSYNKIFCPRVVCYAAVAENFNGGGQKMKIFLFPTKNYNLPLIKKNPGYASEEMSIRK